MNNAILTSWIFVFHSTGDESERGTILTSDGQETLFLAKSLIMALVQRISDASITVANLEILRKNKDRFLKLLEADSSTHDSKTKETERSLDERIGEIQEFEDLRTKLLSFIHMCQLIQPGENKTKKKESNQTDLVTKRQNVKSYWCKCHNVQIAIDTQACQSNCVLWSWGKARLVYWYLMLVACCQSAVAYVFDIVFPMKKKCICNMYVTKHAVGNNTIRNFVIFSYSYRSLRESSR